MSLELVTRVRAALYPATDEAPLNDRVAAFFITAHVAYQLAMRDPSAGWGVIAAKPGSENNAAGYTSDIVAMQNGEHYDVLVDAESGAFPAWQYHEPSQDIRDRWRRSPVTYDLFESPSTPPGPNPPPKSPLEAELDLVMDAIVAMSLEVEALRRAIEKHQPPPYRGTVDLGWLGGKRPVDLSPL